MKFTFFLLLFAVKVTANRPIIAHYARDNETNKTAHFRSKSFPERQEVHPSTGIIYSGPPVIRCSIIGEKVLSFSPKLLSTPQRANHLLSRPSSAQKSATQHSYLIRIVPCYPGQKNMHLSSMSIHRNYCSLSARGEKELLKPSSDF